MELHSIVITVVEDNWFTGSTFSVAIVDHGPLGVPVPPGNAAHQQRDEDGEAHEAHHNNDGQTCKYCLECSDMIE